MGERRSQTIPELNVLRLIAILIVVMNHLGTSLILKDVPWISLATSPLLAIISGFLLFRKLDGVRDLGTKVRQRVTTLALPYFLWTIIYFVAIQGLKASVARWGASSSSLLTHTQPDWSLQNYLSHYVIAPTPGAFWYVQNLILILPVSLIAYPILKLRHSLAPFLLVILAAYALGVPLYFSSRFLPYFVLGAWIGIHQSEGPKTLDWKPGTLWACTLLVVAVSRLLEHFDSPIAAVVRFPVYAIASLLLFSAVRISWNTRWIAQLNRHTGLSFLMHASHQLILAILGGFVWLGFHETHHSLPTARWFYLATGPVLLVVCVYLIKSLDLVLRHTSPHMLSWLNGTRHQSATVTSKELVQRLTPKSPLSLSRTVGTVNQLRVEPPTIAVR